MVYWQQQKPMSAINELSTWTESIVAYPQSYPVEMFVTIHNISRLLRLIIIIITITITIVILSGAWDSVCVFVLRKYLSSSENPFYSFHYKFGFHLKLH